MSAVTDRTRQDTAKFLLAWHADETNRLLCASVDILFEGILDPLCARLGNERVGEAFGPFLNALQEAGDQFDRLRQLVKQEIEA